MSKNRFLTLILLFLLLGFCCNSSLAASDNRIIMPQWQFQPGPWNAITDVPGVQVGHVTIRQDKPFKLRTGVTAIVPHTGNLALTGLWASGKMLNGNGELTGLGFINESGILNAPIMLTNTFSVGAVDTGVLQYYRVHYPGPLPYATAWPGLLPVVGECYDGFFSTIGASNTLTPVDAQHAIETAVSGPVPQGRVGAGTGMRSFGMHAGIGSASRRIQLGSKWYTVGVLVNMNHSHLENLNPQIKEKLENALQKPLALIHKQDDQDRVPITPVLQTPTRQGSIMVVIATDIPLLPHQLSELVTRAALGIGAMGSTMDTTSGDGVIAFSTATPIPVEASDALWVSTTALNPDALSPVFRATVEAVTEAQINALLSSHRADALP